jgi:hypothetical protein
VHPVRRIVVYSPTREHREAFARQTSAKLSIPVRAVDEPDRVVEAADILTSATDAFTPTFDSSLVRPGTHVNSISLAQLDDHILTTASVFTATKGEMVEHGFNGESWVFGRRAALDAKWGEVRELEKVMTGEAPGRQSEDEITVFFPPGAGLQLAALGAEVMARAKQRKLGHTCRASGSLAPERSYRAVLDQVVFTQKLQCRGIPCPGLVHETRVTCALERYQLAARDPLLQGQGAGPPAVLAADDDQVRRAEAASSGGYGAAQELLDDVGAWMPAYSDSGSGWPLARYNSTIVG